MFWKRQLPIAIVAGVGLLTLFGWFVDEPHVEAFVNDDATQWYDILKSFAIFLGALNLLKLQFDKIRKRKPGWPYASLTIGGFFFAITVGFFIRGAYQVEITAPGSNLPAVARVLSGEIHRDQAATANLLSLVDQDKPYTIEPPYFTSGGAQEVVNQLNSGGAQARVVPAEWGSHISTRGGLFNWMFYNIFTPLDATMFALLAFFVASASYRAFRIRNFEATLLLLAGIIIMLGRVPVGSLISTWFVMYILVLGLGIGVNTWWKKRRITFITVAAGLFLVTLAGFFTGWPVDQPQVLFLPVLQDWIYNYPNVAGARAIMIGIGLGIIATSVRYILGIEKSYIGE